MDSTALRASWNPGEHWSLHASWADVKSPEQLEPDLDEERISASALYGRDLGGGRSWSMTFAWGHKNPDHDGSTDALALEAAWAPAADYSRVQSGSRRTSLARHITIFTKSPSFRLEACASSR